MTEGPPEMPREPRHRQDESEPLVQTLRRSSLPYRVLAIFLVFLLLVGTFTVFSAVRADAVEVPASEDPTSESLVGELSSGDPIVSVTFDDGYADQLAASRIMNRHGLKGTFYVSSGLIAPEPAPGDPPSRTMTLSEIRDLRDNGHEIGGHTVNHPNLTTLDPDEIGREICDDRTVLSNYGFKVTSFAYPFAAANLIAQRAAADCGYNSARGLGALQGPNVAGGIGSCDGCPLTETAPLTNPFLTRAPRQVEDNWTLEDLQESVTRAEVQGGWLQLTFHHVDDTGSEISVTPAIFEAFVEWLADRVEAGSVSVRTVDEVVGGAEQATVRGPEPAARTGNMIVNPGLETLDQNGETPDCWQTAGWGDNSPLFTTVDDSRTGKNAQRLHLSTHVDGDAKLLPRMDQGQCSPTVETGRTYNLSAWYKSTGNTQFEIYTRSVLGGWKHWTSSPFLPAAENWDQATFTTPYIPHGVVGLTFGLNILDEGTLVTDDYDMRLAPRSESPRDQAIKFVDGAVPGDATLAFLDHPDHKFGITEVSGTCWTPCIW